MKKNFTIIFATLLCLFSTRGNAQTQFWSDTFEDTGAPSSGTRTPSVEFSCGGPPASSYFFRTTPAGIALNSVPLPNTSYTGFQGSKIWAGEDIDRGPNCSNNDISPNQQVSWLNINITGKSGLSFKGLFAANDQNTWQGSDSGIQQDYVIVEYKIDAGPWTKVLAFYASAADDSPSLKLDTNGDLIGDGAALSYAFSEFSANIPGTGTTLLIRLNAYANGSLTQEFAVDNFRLFETPACTAPVITANPPDRTLCPGSNTTFAVAATGATAYKWQVDLTGTGTYTDLLNVAPYSGVTTNTLTITGATTTMNTYKYRAVAINGIATCFTNSNPGTLSVSNITLASSQDNILCAGSTGSASVIPSGGDGPYTYSWSPSGGTGSIATNLSAGTYTVTVKDDTQCETSKTFIIIDTATPILISPSQTNVSCNGGSNGTATAVVNGGTGLGTYTYSWSHSNLITTATASGLSAGTYTVTVTDANNCSKQQSFTITQPPSALSAITGGGQTNVSCNGGSNGSATVAPTGGTPGYSYSWSPSGGTDATASGLTQGTYTVTVTDANACQTTRVFNITQPADALSAITGGGQTNVSCNGGSNGSATVAPTGGTPGYSYSWSPSGGTAATASGLTQGTYTVTVTDANACQTTRVFNITQPVDALSAITGGGQTNVSCNGGSDGSATVAPTGGTPGYSYSWSPSGGTAATASGLAQGTYTVTVTDANACQTTRVFNITEPIASILSISRAGNILTADQPGATYQWFTCPNTNIAGEIGQSFTPTANGSYGVAITLNGCTVLAPCVNVTSLATTDFEEKSKFMIYPNPSQGIVNVKSDHDTDLSIINQSGQILKTVKVTADTVNTINVENLSDGIYFIREMKGNKPATYKLILKK